MASITRAEYDALRAAGAPIPKVDVLVEANGKRVDLVLTAGDCAVATNARVADPAVQSAIVCLADLTEAYNAGGDGEDPVELSDLIDSGLAFKTEHAEQLYKLVDARLVALEKWRPCAPGQRVSAETRRLVELTVRVVPFLRERGF